jgi:hypothetical protein
MPMDGMAGPARLGRDARPNADRIRRFDQIRPIGGESG